MLLQIARNQNHDYSMSSQENKSSASKYFLMQRNAQSKQAKFKQNLRPEKYALVENLILFNGVSSTKDMPKLKNPFNFGR